MKKLIIKVVVILVCCAAIVGTYKIKTRPDFDIFQSYKMSFDNYEKCCINVIVNVRNYDIDEMYEQVAARYTELNCNVDELTIRLFNSKRDFRRFNLAGEQVIYFNKVF